MEQDNTIMVSICCVTFNHVNYIRQCLEGFMMQKTNFKYEIIINDDCSTDGTVEIIKEYEQQYPDIIKPIYHDENQWSKGVRRILATYVYPKAKGKYYAICEGDDYWIDPFKLQKQVDILEKNSEISLCGTNGISKWDEGTQPATLFNRIWKDKQLTPEEVIGHWVFPTASIIFRPEAVLPMPEWTSKIYSGDMTTILLALNNGHIYASSEITCVYRHSEKNTSSVSRVARSKSREYVTSNHILLYNEFNKYSSGKFSKVIIPLIKKLETRQKVYKAMNKSSLLAFLTNPIVFIEIAVASIKRKYGLTI